MKRHWLVAVLMFGFCGICQGAGGLVVHEWGTFTSLQDEQGKALGGINTDDEPVPAFVHQMSDYVLFPPTIVSRDAKGTPVAADNPDVTMRLETPVLYFHLPKNQTGPVVLDVTVGFKGGWLSQYFPDAQADVDGNTQFDQLPRLTPKTLGRLSWRGLILNTNQGAFAQTNAHVWTGPRDVQSAAIAKGDEREQFLFYRGVGKIDAPLSVVRNGKTAGLEVRSAPGGPAIERLWLVDIRADGSAAFRTVERVAGGGMSATRDDFQDGDYSPARLAELRGAMHEELMAEGLADDEANALLRTWELSYFQDPGERLFFMVPREWTDAILPLTLSVPAEITRVMVGRIELVTPAQRVLLSRIAETPAADMKNLTQVTTAMDKLRKDPARSTTYNALAGGRGNPKDLGVPVPRMYADFLALGRFRTALLENYIHNSDAREALRTALIEH